MASDRHHSQSPSPQSVSANHLAMTPDDAGFLNFTGLMRERIPFGVELALGPTHAFPSPQQMVRVLEERFSRLEDTVVGLIMPHSLRRSSSDIAQQRRRTLLASADAAVAAMLTAQSLYLLSPSTPAVTPAVTPPTSEGEA